MPNCRSTFVLVLSAAVAVVLAGCQDEEPIRQYTVVKPDVLNERIETPPVAGETQPLERYPARTLGAIVPRDRRTWFFKLLGPDEAVAREEQAFREFLQTVKFTDGKPTWTVPEGWNARLEPPGGLRYATIVIPSEGDPLQLTVIPLGTPAGDAAEYLLANINRWRNELGLPPIVKDALGEHSETLAIGDVTATLVNIAGEASQSSSMGGAPFARGAAGGGFTHPPISADRRNEPGAPESLPIDFETPAGWQPGRTGPFRLVAFEATRGDETAEITVSSLGPQELLPNVNRWRGQVGLEAIGREQLEQDVGPIEVAGASGHLVELIGPEQAILAAILNHGGRAWIFKLQGPSELVQQEQDRFEAFVRSVKFK